jgi:hypothetical protein
VFLKELICNFQMLPKYVSIYMLEKGVTVVNNFFHSYSTIDIQPSFSKPCCCIQDWGMRFEKLYDVYILKMVTRQTYTSNFTAGHLRATL